MAENFRAADGLNDTPVSASNPLPTASMPFPAEAANLSGTITSGGTAQDLFPAGSYHGFGIQNQSTGYLYIRSKGAAGTTVATADQNSFRLAPDGYYEPAHISAYAVSIIGASMGQAFYCRTW